MHTFDALPVGAFDVTFEGRRYRCVKTVFATGRSAKLVAHEAGGADYISLNVYYLSSGVRVFPCEMPLEKVVRFVTGATVPDCPPGHMTGAGR